MDVKITTSDNVVILSEEVEGKVIKIESRCSTLRVYLNREGLDYFKSIQDRLVGIMGLVDIDIDNLSRVDFYIDLCDVEITF